MHKSKQPNTMLVREAYTLTEVLRILPIGRTTLRKMVDAKQIRVVKIGGRSRKLFVPRSEIERLLSAERDAA